MSIATSAPLVYQYPYAFAFWPIFAWAYWPELLLITRRRPKAAVVDAGSSRVLIAGLALAFAGAFALAGSASLRWSPAISHLAFFTGLALLVSGSLLRRHCWRVLDRYFTSHVAAQTDQRVITSGAYAWVRHPAYSGALLMNTGIGFALGSWASLALLLIASVALYSYRIAVEEKFLLLNLGEPYRAFMMSRKRLVPHVY
jgi:protein-S-isoprenylcysteine O-methyltransferase Ste14